MALQWTIIEGRAPDRNRGIGIALASDRFGGQGRTSEDKEDQGAREDDSITGFAYYY